MQLTVDSHFSLSHETLEESQRREAQEAMRFCLLAAEYQEWLSFELPSLLSTPLLCVRPHRHVYAESCAVAADHHSNHRTHMYDPRQQTILNQAEKLHTSCG